MGFSDVRWKVFGPIVRPALRMLARALWQRGLLASNLAYDIVVSLFKVGTTNPCRLIVYGNSHSYARLNRSS
jgi:hypothetical protein